MLYCTLRQGAVVPVPSRCLYRRQACLYESPTGLQSILWERACPRWYRCGASKFAVLVSHPPVESARQSGPSRRSALGQKWPSCLVHIKPSMSRHRSMVHTVPPLRSADALIHACCFVLWRLCVGHLRVRRDLEPGLSTRVQLPPLSGIKDIRISSYNSAFEYTLQPNYPLPHCAQYSGRFQQPNPRSAGALIRASCSVSWRLYAGRLRVRWGP